VNQNNLHTFIITCLYESLIIFIIGKVPTVFIFSYLKLKFQRNRILNLNKKYDFISNDFRYFVVVQKLLTMAKVFIFLPLKHYRELLFFKHNILFKLFKHNLRYLYHELIHTIIHGMLYWNVSINNSYILWYIISQLLYG